MNYSDPKLRDLLAGEYMLGTLAGAARRRFERLLREDLALRDAVSAWERRLAPLTEAVEPVQPPRRLWSRIEQRIAPVERVSLLRRLGFWRPLALAASVTVVLLATRVFFAAMPPPANFVAVLSDQQAQPAWLVSAADFRQVSIKALRAPRDAEHAYELWLLPGGDQPPRSLGLMPVSGDKVVAVPAALQAAMASGKVLAVSVEPPGGSPTGLPTGPVLYQGVILSAG